MDPEIKVEKFDIFSTKHVIPESLKFSHWLSEGGLPTPETKSQVAHEKRPSSTQKIFRGDEGPFRDFVSDAVLEFLRIPNDGSVGRCWYIYLLIYHKNQPNIVRYTIHGYYGHVTIDDDDHNGAPTKVCFFWI